MVRAALRACVDNADGVVARDPKAVRAVMEGLVLSGVAADWAGVSRPVSGVEHYFSHIWDMRALEFGSPFDLHGIQCGIGTLYALRGYEALAKTTPNPERANRRFAAFDRYFPHDARGNVREGPCTVVEASDNICVARNARISLLGVKNLVVVTTPDSVLVADKSRLTDMKKLFKK